MSIKHATPTSALAPGAKIGVTEWDQSHVIDPGTIAFADLAGLPSTLAGYGIGDGITAAAVAAGYQPISAVLTGTTASYTTAEKTKLAAIATGATANATDAQLRDRSTHTGTQAASTISDFASAADARVAVGITGKQDVSAKGAAGGYAGLDGTGKVPAAQLPSYVDDVVEATNLAAFPGVGETGKIYVALDTNKTWRWSGSAYVEISPSPGSTDSVTEGSTNLYFTAPRAIASALTGFAAAASRTPVVAADTVVAAFGKVQKYLSDLAAVAFTGAWSDLTGRPTTLAAAGIMDAKAKAAVAMPYLIPPSGEYMLTSNGAGSAMSAAAGAAGRMELYPFSPRLDVAITGLAVNVSTGVASALAKILVYASDSNGRPAGLLFESSDLDCSTTGVKTAAWAATLNGDVIYWLGVRHSSTATLSQMAASGVPDINGGTPVTPGRKSLRRTLTYATATPSTWGWTSSEINAVSPPAIWLQV